MNVRRTRALQSPAKYAGDVIHRDQPGLAFALGESARPRLFLERQANPPRGICLTAYVNADFLVFADADRHKAPDGMCRRCMPHPLGDVSENSIANGLT